MIWVKLINWIPMILMGLVFLWLLFLEIRWDLKAKNARNGLIAILMITLLQVAAKIIYLYISLKASPMGNYLLPGSGSHYLSEAAWQFLQPAFYSLIVGIGLIVFLLIIGKIFRSSVIDRLDIYIILMTIVAVGHKSAPILILGSFLIMVLTNLFYRFFKHGSKEMRLQIGAFLIISAFIILIIKNFMFYNVFLQIIHITI